MQSIHYLLATLPSLCGPSHPPSWLGLGHVTAEPRFSSTALRHSHPWSNSPDAARWCVWRHCPVEKRMLVQLNANWMGWHVSAGCCGSHAGSMCLQFWLEYQQCHQQSTPTQSRLHLHASRRAASMQRASAHLFLWSTKTRQVESKVSIWRTKPTFPLV